MAPCSGCVVVAPNESGIASCTLARRANNVPLQNRLSGSLEQNIFLVLFASGVTAGFRPMEQFA
jgi:hypothetical protein